MISDTLFDALTEMQSYLDDPVMSRAYADPLIRAEIDRVMAAMRALLERLDEAPAEDIDTLRQLLLEELTRANGSETHSRDMVERIADGRLTLPAIHSDKAHDLARRLRKAVVATKKA